MPRKKYIQVESKNALLELLKDEREFERIYLASSAYKDPKTREIVQIAGQRGIKVIRASRRDLKRRSKTGASESIIGLMIPQNAWDLDVLLEHLYSEDEIPFLLIFEHIKYSQNIGAILRTAFAGGVNGVITPVKKQNLVNDDVLRVSMGAAERIPMVEMNLFSALKQLKENAIKIFSLDMEGEVYFDTDLRGPCAFVLGAEDVGISQKILERSDKQIKIPMREGIGSLNVSASASAIIYEKLRQEVRGID